MELNDYQFWKIGFDVLQTLALIMLWIFTRSTTVNDRVDDNQRRLAQVETHIKNMPEFKNMESMNNKLHAVDNKVAEIKGQLFGIEKKISMIDQHLMDQK